MDKRTRVLNALEGKAVDRPPISFWHHYSGARAEGETCVASHLDYYRTTGIDFIKIMSDGFFGYPLESGIKTASDWKDLRPLAKNHPYIEKQVERVRRINEELAGECCSFYTVFAPFSIIRFATSDELVMAHLKEGRDSVLQALQVIAEGNAVLADRIIREGGCEGAFLAFQGGERDRFSADQYRELIAPSDLSVVDAANAASSHNIAHLCAWAGFKNRLEVWRDYPVPVFNWAVHIEGMSLAEGRRYFGGKTVMGGYDNRNEGILYSGTEEAIKKATREILGANTDTGLILGADCSLPSDIDENRVRWAVEAVSDFVRP